MNDNRKAQSSFGVLLRDEASQTVEKAVFSIDALAKSIGYIVTGADSSIDAEQLSVVMELAIAIEDRAKEIKELTVNGEEVEIVKMEGNRIQLAT
ncbi:hypothetical protein [Nitratifractor sp.]